MPSLIDLIAGGSPTAPEATTGAIYGGLAANPSAIPLDPFQRIMGEMYQAKAAQQAQGVSNQVNAAMPSLIRAYASDDPWTTILNDPSAPAYAKYMIGNQSTAEVAQAKHGLAAAGLTGAQTQVQREFLRRLQSGGALPPTAAGGGAVRANVGAVATGEPAASTAAPFQFPGRMTPETPAAPGTQATTAAPGTAEPAAAKGEPDLGQLQAMTPEQRDTTINNMSPTQLYQLRRQIALRNAQAKAFGVQPQQQAVAR